ncbi:MAG TPA: winged helix-turn-helix domain-containing protein [Pirellulaceae bacterium]|nr:winged helix-turn-helix domain-containing protein [Pirellulaceae bacterium]
MTTAMNSSAVHQIGEAAGAVWKVLSKSGPLSVAKLAEATNVNRDLFMQALGWLAREDKIDINESKRGRIVSLKAEV